MLWLLGDGQAQDGHSAASWCGRVTRTMCSGPGSSRSTVRPAGTSERTDAGNRDDRIGQEEADLAQMVLSSSCPHPLHRNAEEPRFSRHLTGRAARSAAPDPLRCIRPARRPPPGGFAHVARCVAAAEWIETRMRKYRHGSPLYSSLSLREGERCGLGRTLMAQTRQGTSAAFSFHTSNLPEPYRVRQAWPPSRFHPWLGALAAAGRDHQAAKNWSRREPRQGDRLGSRPRANRPGQRSLQLKELLLG